MTKAVWVPLAIFATAGIAMVWLYPDGYQQDAGHHFLFARAAWAHPQLFVGVWNRPLFTLIYAVPALAGYSAAKLVTLAITLVTAYQTYRLAGDRGVARAPLAVTLLFLQPSVFMLCSETMTEPLLALVFVVALRLRSAGRETAGMLVASLMVLARPEGFFLALLWGVWVLVGRSGAPGSDHLGSDHRWSDPKWSDPAGVLTLSTGAVVWWLSAWLITGDPWFIKHDWPPNWDFTSAVYGTGPWWTYLARLPEIAGPALAFVFLSGLVRLLRRRQQTDLTSAFLMLLVLHTVLRTFGWLGSAGYARYFVSVAPAIAIITLEGWNRFLDGGDPCTPPGDVARGGPHAPLRSVAIRRAAAVLVLGLSAAGCVLYVDMAGFYDRDARAVSDMHRWFLQHPRPVARLLWSQSYMCIAFRCDPLEAPSITGDRAANLGLLRSLPAGTLVFWESDTGPSWYKLTDADFDAAGYERLLSRDYALDGWLQESRWLPKWKPRPQRMHLFYKSAP